MACHTKTDNGHCSGTGFDSSSVVLVN